LGRTRKKPASEQIEVLDAEIAADPEFVQTLLEVYRELELSAQLDSLLGRAARWCDAEYGFALGVSGDRRTLGLQAGTMRGDDPRYKSVGRVAPDRLKQWLARGHESFEGFGPFAELVPEWPAAPPAHSLGIPVLNPLDRWAGALWLMLPAPPAPDAVARVQRMCDLVRTAIGNALQVLSMKELVIKDDTASCFNRRHFEEFLPEELSRASRFRSPVSLIFLDMDNLKEVNNRFGHSMGSRTLYEVSVRIRSKIRKFDKLFRFGGDEFCIVLPETEWHGALEVAERVRDAVASKPFLMRDLKDESGVKMTASLGVASYPLHARSQRDLVQQADRAMHKIKQGSKNAIGISEITGGDDGT